MKPIRVDFKPSVIFNAVIISATLAACLTLMLMPLMWQLKLPLVLAVFSASVYTILHQGLLSMSRSIVSIQINIKNELYVERQDGRKEKLNVAGNTTVMPYLIVMNLHKPDTDWYRLIFSPFNTHSVIVLPDSTDTEAFRQLRVWLRWAQH